MCEAELWEEALIELKRQSYAKPIRQQEAAWRAIIYLGMKHYQEVLDLEEKVHQDACNIDVYLAVAYARLGETDKALKITQNARRVKRYGADMALGHVYFERQEYDLALRAYEKEAQELSERAAVQRAIGRTLRALGDYREARIAYEQTIRLTPFVRPEDLLDLAECLHKTGHDRAAAEMEQLADEKA